MYRLDALRRDIAIVLVLVLGLVSSTVLARGTLVVTNNTDATLRISAGSYFGNARELNKPVPPGRTISFFNALPRGTGVIVYAEVPCVRGVGTVHRRLVVSGSGRYQLKFDARDFGKSFKADHPGCGAGGERNSPPATGSSAIGTGSTGFA